MSNIEELEFSSSSDDEMTDSIIDVNNDGGIIKEILKNGTGVDTPKSGSQVDVLYRGTFLDGKEFDSSLDSEKPFQFTAGQGQVIKGWDNVIMTMKKGEKAKVTLTPEYAYGENGSGSIPPNSTLVFEMELLSFQNEKDISKNKDKSILKAVIVQGDKYQTPNYESYVTVSYNVKLLDQEDILFEVQNGEYRIGDGQLVSGLETAIESMKSNERSVFTIRSQHAYGNEGTEHIPGGSTVVFDVTLHSFERVPETWTYKAFKEKLDQAELRKSEGNEFFKQKEYDLAIRKYERANKFIDSDKSNFTDEEKVIANQFKEVVFLNLALVYFNRKDFTKSLKNTMDVLKTNPDNVKGLYRRAMIEIERDEWREAKKTLKKILALDPTNTSAIRATKSLNKKIEHIKSKEKSMYSNLFS